ncbi:protein of unknown function [Moraxella cuniculi DSM 21768]|uniref:DUF4440 domain-containing protein n=2 Tax=Moraxella cuniculi TaxID=34061 RepID=A0A1N7ELS2_9GAMM|nr:DUF4440 domain-containing protein [Moraxella cuniculi]OOS07762.1 hypothetical protein B0189_02570 [Moraxella cuniculi]SIR89053.1 protein of unknown function [Moraxella cuniculi DSM 21768]VEG13599.1 Uncharacterised protein [Moraxella cuniculi]
MKSGTRNFFKKAAAASVLTGTLGLVGKLAGKPISKGLSLGLFVGALGVQSLITTNAYAISESDINRYASAISSAANAQNIAQVSRLIADDAIISLSRNGKTSSLDKEGYLQLLQKSWAKSTGYQYRIDISDIVTTGNQARAQVVTTETWTQDGKPITVKTVSRATLSQTGNNTVLLRSVAQVTID